MAGAMISSLLVKLALIGVIGIGAQWLAWRTGRPAIALMLIAGVIAGPVLGIIVPERDLGPLQEPIIKLAVAVILFEGGLSLNFRDLRHAGGPVLRLVILGVPIGWTLGTLAAHYGAGLGWEVSLLFGGILVVTGPTVIGPMLRTLNVPHRVSDTLKWEGIVNDPIGALLAIGIYGWITYEGSGGTPILPIATDVLLATAAAALIGLALGFALTWLFPRGAVPEYLKSPVLLVTVIGGFVAADSILHETGLITVTVMGVVMANREVQSSRALRRFKEDLTVLLVSGVFIILSATLDWQTLSAFRWRFVLFLLLLLFAVRPMTVFASLAFSRMPLAEQAFVAWIAPRGIVAVAITGLFAIRLQEAGVQDAEALVPLSFGVVIATIFAHGFSAGRFARWLGIDQGKGDGVLIVGANDWTIGLAEQLHAMERRVLIADTSSFALRRARQLGIPVHRGEILDEVTSDDIDLHGFSTLVAASENDAYNALVAADLGPEMGSHRIVQTAPSGKDRPTRGQLMLDSARTVDQLQQLIAQGWAFRRTRITEKFSLDAYRATLGPGGEVVAVDRAGALAFTVQGRRPAIQPGDSVIAFVPPEATARRTEERARRARDQADAATGGTDA
jgi:NhaP-type Na+/H+ or K+/H+ antiporter